MDGPDAYQKALLREFAFSSSFGPLSPAFEAAFLATPRHHFIHRYRRPSEADWSSFVPTDYHLGRVYRDEPLTIGGDGEYAYSSSSSQPSFVLGLAELLGLQSGDRVLEVGSGSGWLLSVLGHVVGPAGEAVGLDVIEELVCQSVADLRALGRSNCKAIHADANSWQGTGEPFDAVIFTCGAYAVPKNIIRCCKIGGKILIPLQIAGHGNIVFLFERTPTGLRSIRSMDAYFVPLQGQAGLHAVAGLAEWQALGHCEARSIQPFCWGNYLPKIDFINRSGPFRTYLSIAYAAEVRTFDLSGTFKREGFSFGFADTSSAALVTRQGIECFGEAWSEQKLREALRAWVNLGMPIGASYALEIVPDELADPDAPWRRSHDGLAYVWTLRPEAS